MIYAKKFHKPPKDRRFLAHNRQFSGDGRGNWTQLGFTWQEAFWDGKEYRLWCGNKSISTTEGLNYDVWAELPS